MNCRQTDSIGSTSTNGYVDASGGAVIIYISRIRMFTASTKIMATVYQRCKWQRLSAARAIRAKVNVRLYSYTNAFEPVRGYV